MKMQYYFRNIFPSLESRRRCCILQVPKTMNAKFLSKVWVNRESIANAVSFGVPHRRMGAMYALEQCQGKSPEQLDDMRRTAFNDLHQMESTSLRNADYQLLRGYCDVMKWVDQHAGSYA